MFQRISDIFNSNVNAVLNTAEDPKKMVDFMIKEVEDITVEVKANCAEAMASKRSIKVEIERYREQAKVWTKRASLAATEGNKDLAETALIEKNRIQKVVAELEVQSEKYDEHIKFLESQIGELDVRLSGLRSRRAVWIHKINMSKRQQKTERRIREFDDGGIIARLDAFDHRFTDACDCGTSESVESQFTKMEEKDEVKSELDALMSIVKGKKGKNK